MIRRTIVPSRQSQMSGKEIPYMYVVRVVSVGQGVPRGGFHKGDSTNPLAHGWPLPR